MSVRDRGEGGRAVVGLAGDADEGLGRRRGEASESGRKGGLPLGGIGGCAAQACEPLVQGGLGSGGGGARLAGETAAHHTGGSQHVGRNLSERGFHLRHARLLLAGQPLQQRHVREAAGGVCEVPQSRNGGLCSVPGVGEAAGAQLGAGLGGAALQEHAEVHRLSAPLGTRHNLRQQVKHCGDVAVQGVARQGEGNLRGRGSVHGGSGADRCADTASGGLLHLRKLFVVPHLGAELCHVIGKEVEVGDEAGRDA
mmetsp:Transcript_8078/g.23161  ORF Transcript_8078/g.23161 Transcript_8078/m.23161 type:complete len:254 (-) Transcript_8078:1780-2541(-)